VGLRHYRSYCNCGRACPHRRMGRRAHLPEVYLDGSRTPIRSHRRVSISWLAKLTSLLPRITLMSDFGHASRAKGDWSDPARVILNHRAPGRFYRAGRALGPRSQSKLGLTSAPLWPQAWQVNRGSRSDSRTSSGHRSPLIVVEWLHL